MDHFQTCFLRQGLPVEGIILLTFSLLSYAMMSLNVKIFCGHTNLTIYLKKGLLSHTVKTMSFDPQSSLASIPFIVCFLFLQEILSKCLESTSWIACLVPK